jgi:HlyD family secretion protein
VAIAGEDGRVEWRGVRVKRDFGQTIELDQGLTGRERVVLSPPTDLRDGQSYERRDDPGQERPLQAANG